jgi:DNA polymerase-3 subunit delta
MPPKPAATPAKEASPLRVVQAAVQARQFAPVYYLHGDDDFLKDSAIRDLLAAAIDPSTRDFNLETRRANDLDAEALASLLTTPPMLAERRAVVLRDVTALKKAARTQLDRYLRQPASDTLVLLVSPAGTKADTALANASVSLDFAPLTPERVRKWITHHATTALQVDIADDATQLLQQAVGNDLHLLAAEIDKCASYVLGVHDASGTSAEGRARIDVDAVSAVVGVRRGETVTDLLDAVARHDAKIAVALVGHVLGQPKVTAVQVVMMLSTQAFALSFGRARRDAGIPTSRLPQEFFAFLKETGGYPGRPWGEAASAWTKVTDQWSADACQRAITLLLEADMALKDTTVSNAEQILMSLVLGLCALRTRKAA